MTCGILTKKPKMGAASSEFSSRSAKLKLTNVGGVLGKPFKYLGCLCKTADRNIGFGGSGKIAIRPRHFEFEHMDVVPQVFN